MVNVEKKLTKEQIEKDLKFFMETDPLGKIIYDRLDKL